MKTVLVVDDAVFMRTTIKRMLEDQSFNVIGEASNGAEAVEMYRNLLPDVVTMDVTMPGMTGIEAVEAIISEDPNAKIVMVTALGQQKLIVDAIERGAKDFVTKPFNPEQIIQVLTNVTDEYDGL
ncbi:two-component system chemotaxis response regulator CheY [Psychrobacillus insolitus]|uniref:Two-component system chemotaxis response regulator CheY n=1 Tax=Psychrobacillus insolitus TaxID=1461 RepID=A0A2W7NAD5_9BACI|nr:response regulator [Psychrobacillus insolitus]PZX07469.1 two-component system chemotaxis response regulator CheY [Psychrobacillus insolitus]